MDALKFSNKLILKGYLTFLCIQLICAVEVEEICMGEIMDIRCDADEVLLVETASFGPGRCTRNNRGDYCNVDMLEDADRWCTGRQSCRRTIFDAHFKHVCDGPADHSLSFHITYSCQTVMQVSGLECANPISIQDTSGLFLMSDLLENNCAQSHTPLILEAKSGQRFNFTQLDANVYDTDNACANRLGQVKDLANEKTVDICGGKQRETELLLTNGNRLELVLKQGKTATVLFKYEVLGCADLDTIPGSSMHRQDNKVTVECENGRTWDLYCKDNSWIGAQGSCLKESASMQHIKHGGSDSAVSKNVVVIVVGAIILVAAAAIICVGIVQLVHTLPCHPALRRKRKGGYGLPPEQSSEDETVYNDGTGLPMQPISRSFVQLNTGQIAQLNTSQMAQLETINKQRGGTAGTPTVLTINSNQIHQASPTVMTLNSNYENMSANGSQKGPLYEVLELQALEAQGIIPPGTARQHSRQGSVVSIPVSNMQMSAAINMQGGPNQPGPSRSSNNPPLPVQAPKRQKSWVQSLRMRNMPKPGKNSFRKSAPLPVPRVQSILRESAAEQAPVSSRPPVSPVTAAPPSVMTSSVPVTSPTLSATAQRKSSQTAPRRIVAPPSPDTPNIEQPIRARNENKQNPTNTSSKPNTTVPTYSVPIRNSMLQSEMPDVVYQTTEACYLPARENEEVYEVPMQVKGEVDDTANLPPPVPEYGTASRMRKNMGSTDSLPPPPPPEELLPLEEEDEADQEYIYTDMSGAKNMKANKALQKKAVPEPITSIEDDPDLHKFQSLDLTQPIKIPDFLDTGTKTLTKAVPPTESLYANTIPENNEESLYANLAPPPISKKVSPIQRSGFDSSDYGALCEHSSNVRAQVEPEEDVYATAQEYYRP